MSTLLFLFLLCLFLFTIFFLHRANIPFQQAHYLVNPWNGRKKVQISCDGSLSCHCVCTILQSCPTSTGSIPQLCSDGLHCIAWPPILPQPIISPSPYHLLNTNCNNWCSLDISRQALELKEKVQEYYFSCRVQIIIF